MKSKDLYNKIVDQLINTYPIEEAQSVATLLLEAYCDVTKMDITVNKEIEYGQSLEREIVEAINKLIQNEPIQYVLGIAHFYGRDFKVNPSVLIPRRETEELVHLIIQDHPSFNGKILDIGTGSGCIPITLKLEIPDAQVDALEISEGALTIAKQNSRELEAEITFYELDILSGNVLSGVYDIIVSNPPYVTHKEKEKMQNNVLDNEPHLALFVEDNSPLIFYSAIIQAATSSLTNGGFLYFEINEQFGQEVASALQKEGFEKIEIIQDMQGKDRIVKGVFVQRD